MVTSIKSTWVKWALWCLAKQISLVTVKKKQIWCTFLRGQLCICTIQIVFPSLGKIYVEFIITSERFKWNCQQGRNGNDDDWGVVSDGGHLLTCILAPHLKVKLLAAADTLQIFASDKSFQLNGWFLKWGFHGVSGWHIKSTLFTASNDQQRLGRDCGIIFIFYEVQTPTNIYRI